MTTLNVGTLLDHHNRLRPGRDAVVMGDRRFSYAQLLALANKVANGLRALGLEPGDHVALTCPNVPYFPIVYFGILRAGGVVVPLNVLLKPREIAYHLKDSDAKAYFCFEGTPELPMGDWGRDAFDQVESCEHLVVMTADPTALTTPEGDRTLASLIGPCSHTFAPVPTRPDDTAVILYTSGTTGQPKGAELTHLNLQLNAWGVADIGRAHFDASPDGHNVLLVTLPLFHSFGQVCQMLTGLLQGGTIVLLPRFEPAAVLTAMLRERVTSWAAVPTMFWSLAEHVARDGADVAAIRQHLRICISGGAAMPVELMKRFEALFEVRILEGYGLSETSPVATFNHHERPSQPGTVGTPILGIDRGSRDPRPQHHEGVLQAPRRHGRGDAERLVPYRRSGPPERRGLSEHRRSHEGHDHPRRLQRVSPRARGGADDARRRLAVRGGRHCRRAPRRGGQGVRGAAARRRPHRGGAAALVPRAVRRLQGAAHRRVPRPAADDLDRQDPEARAAGFDVTVAAPETAHDAVAAARGLAKARRRLLPFLFLLYVVAYLDRVNVGFAGLQMNQALGFTPAVFGFGAGIFFLTYTLFEVPSNLLLERFGARLWIARIMISWGLVSSGTAFVQGASSFYVLRLLLGLGEAGFFPGIILYLTYWFPAAERARATAYFMTAVALASVVGGPISGLLLSLDGWLGLDGWQWLFLLEGVPATLLGVVVLAVLPDGPADARWLTEEERRAVLAQVRQEHDRAASWHHHRLGAALASSRVWLLGALYFCTVAGLYGIGFWLPQILQVRQAGWSVLRIGLVSAVPYVAAALAMALVGAHSDRTGERRWHVVLSLWTGAAGFVLATLTTAPVASVAALSLAAMGIYSALGPFWTLPTAFLRGAAAAGGIALVNSIGNVGGFVGPYAVGFARDATGRFESALLLLAATLAVGGVLALVLAPRAGRG
jgi:ACS family tartrate transporter-like MFS transporter